MTDTQSVSGTQSTLGAPESRDSEIRSEWERALSHAHINHEGMAWELIQCDSDIPEDVAYDRLVSWTSNFLGVVDHAHEWGGFDA